MKREHTAERTAAQQEAEQAIARADAAKTIRELQSYTTKNPTKTQEQEHQNYKSTTMKKTKQTQDDEHQIVLSQQRKELNDYMPAKSIQSIELGECRPTVVEAKKRKDEPAQRVLKIEEIKQRVH